MAEQIYECEARLFQANQTTGKRALTWVRMRSSGRCKWVTNLKRGVQDGMDLSDCTKLDLRASLLGTLSAESDSWDAPWGAISKARDLYIRDALR